MSIQHNTSATTIYGIKNCDTIKKARLWLSLQGIDYSFHDYRADGLERDWLQQAERQLGWEALLNKRGTTFRQLSEQQKAGLSKDTAVELLLSHPAMIKRPLLIHNGNYYLGFSASLYQEVFA
jgi:Spx/MgsR family transcriptional regulator